MKVGIIGAGLVGSTTAYTLAIEGNRTGNCPRGYQ